MLAEAQPKQLFEIGVTSGTSQYQGDLSPQLKWNGYAPFTEVWGKKVMSPFFGIKAGIAQTTISGIDSLSTNDFQQRRYLSFSNKVTRFAVSSEFHFRAYKPGGLGTSFTPYLNLGLAVNFSNPTAQFNGLDVTLSDKGTEGEYFLRAGSNLPYRKAAIALPIQAGLKVYLGGPWALAIEAGVTHVFSDYLDDVSSVYPGYSNFAIEKQKQYFKYSDRSSEIGMKSQVAGKQRGVAAFNDAYYHAGITLIYSISSGVCAAFQR